jgi:hypothetical protein
MRGIASFCCGCLFFALVAPGLAAQVDSGTIRGVVQDQTGAIIPAPVVTLVDQAGNLLATTQTTTAGQFTFERIAPGGYQIRAAFAGFQTATERVRVSSARALPPRKMTLQLAAVTQEVTVGHDTPTAADSNRDAIVLDDTALRDLPTCSTC